MLPVPGPSQLPRAARMIGAGGRRALGREDLACDGIATSKGDGDGREQVGESVGCVVTTARTNIRGEKAEGFPGGRVIDPRRGDRNRQEQGRLGWGR